MSDPFHTSLPTGEPTETFPSRSEEKRIRTMRGDKNPLDPRPTSETRAGEQEGSTMEFCQICGQVNPTWFAPSELWNRVIPERSGMLCPNCFIARAERQGVHPTAWELRLETFPAAPVQTGEGSTMGFISDQIYSGPSCTLCGAAMQYKCLSCGSTPALVEGGSTGPDTPTFAPVDRAWAHQFNNYLRAESGFCLGLPGLNHLASLFAKRAAASVQGEGVAPSLSEALAFMDRYPSANILWTEDKRAYVAKVMVAFVAAQAAEIAEMNRSLQTAVRSREHTQDWYARHYGKVEDWARKELPEPYVHDFFCCIANGSSSVHDSDYFRVDTAEGQLILDQTRRAEEAELRTEDLASQLTAAQQELVRVRSERDAETRRAAGAYDLGLGAAETLIGELRTLVDKELADWDGDGVMPRSYTRDALWEIKLRLDPKIQEIL